MTFILRWINRTIGLTLLMGAAALTTALAIALIAVQLIGEEALVERVACHIGLSDKCVRDQLEESQQELERQRREGARLRGRIAEMEAVLGRLSALDHAASSYVIFYRDTAGRFDVVTGHQYASLLDPETLTAGWCYIDVDRGSALRGSLYISRFDADLALRNDSVSAEDRRAANLPRGAIDEARSRCTWPDGVS